MYIKVFRNQPDLKIVITKDKIINIIGLIGSGKSFLAGQYKSKPEYNVITLDTIFFSSNPMQEREDIRNIEKILENKHGPLMPDKFNDYYLDIVDYLINDSKKRIGVLDGAQIYYFVSTNKIKGQVIIKGTSVFNSWIRVIKREISDKNKKLKNKEITFSKYINKLFRILIRRTKQIKDYKILNNFIKEITIKDKK